MPTPRVLFEVAIAALIAGACWYAYHFAYTRGADSVQVAWDADKQAQAEQTAAIKDQADKKTAALQTQVDHQRSQSNAKIAKLSSDLAAAIDWLHDRPARPGEGSVPDDTGPGTTGCTGAQLYRSDAEFLTRLAAERDSIAIQLGSCQAAYGAARDALN